MLNTARDILSGSGAREDTMYVCCLRWWRLRVPALLAAAASAPGAREAKKALGTTCPEYLFAGVDFTQRIQPRVASGGEGRATL